MTGRSNLGSEKISKLLLQYSVPAMMGSLVYILYNIVDRIFISYGVGRMAMAGLSITLPLFAFILAIGLFIGVGSGSLISLKLGAGKHSEAEKILGNAIVLFLGAGLIMSTFGLHYLDNILKVFGASPNNINYAYDYMSVIFYALPFQLCFIGLNHIIRGEGSPKVAMKMSIIGCGLNIVLDPIFIFTLNMGIKGAALATVISNVLVAVMQIYYFIGKKQKSHIKLKLSSLKLDFKIFKGISSIGIAPFIMQLSNSIVVIFINKNLNIYGGDITIAAYGIINSLSVLFYMPLIGLYQGSQPILGFNYGAKQYKRVKETLVLSLKAGTVISTIAFLSATFIPKVLVRPFINNDPELLKITSEYLSIIFRMIFLSGLNVIGGFYFQAIGKAKITTFLNLSRQLFLMVPLIMILPKYLGIKGVWLATPIMESTLVLFTSIFVVREFKRLNKLIAEK